MCCLKKVSSGFPSCLWWTGISSVTRRRPSSILEIFKTCSSPFYAILALYWSVSLAISLLIGLSACLSSLHPFPPISNYPQVLVGVVKDEGSYFLVYGVPGFSKDNESLISRAQFLAGVRIGVPQASDLAAEAVVLHYTDWLHPEDPAHLRDAMSAVVGDHNVVCPVAQLAGRLAAQGARVYAYIFEHRASTLTWPLWMGVPHGYEIEFIFGLPLDPSLNYTVEERIFAQRLMKYWTNFARTGDPNDPRDSKSPRWPPYTTAAQQYVSLNLKPLEVRRGLRAQTCAFWNRFLPKLLSATDTLDEAERQWKAEFHRWSSYMVHWKNQFDHYSKQERCSDL
ncbi:acetylcholinesterase isoform X5 [Rattus norvegicus]|uniref:acetylcholinesterase isoform X5 n=1 Tax=Rattus norvegicus TaxID=10116 RepID=UPI002FD812AD